jgi:hypothetical protein
MTLASSSRLRTSSILSSDLTSGMYCRVK